MFNTNYNNLKSHLYLRPFMNGHATSCTFRRHIMNSPLAKMLGHTEISIKLTFMSFA